MDSDFLAPFKPEDFAKEHVHVPRQSGMGFLFRIDPRPMGRYVILVQSAAQPDWSYAFHNANYLLAAPPEVRPYDPRFVVGERLRYRLLANPTRKIETKTGADGRRNNGRRVPVPTDELFSWLARKAALSGFTIDEPSTVIQPSFVIVDKPHKDGLKRLRSARYDGVLTVSDPTVLRETLVRGIGPGKGFGFGLLSVARVTHESQRPSSPSEVP